MAEPFKLTRIPTLKTVADFRNHVASLGIELPCEDVIMAGPASPLAQPAAATISVTDPASGTNRFYRIRTP